METPRALTAAVALACCVLSAPAFAEDDDFDLSNAPTTAAGPPPTHNAIPMLPMPSVSQPAPPYSNEVVVGGGWTSGAAMRYGRYTGLGKAGGIGLGAFKIHSGDAWDSGGTFYFDAEGMDLGIDGRSGALKFGEQGKWGVNLYYNGIANYYSSQFHTVWNTNGSLATGVAAGSITNATTLASKLNVMDISSQRDIFGGGGKMQYGDWLVQVALRHEHKEGYKENSLAILGAPSPIAANGNITSSALAYFAEPINYDTDRYDVTAQYSQGKFQALLGYTFNNFTDNLASDNLVNPFQFTNTASVTGVAGGAAAGSKNITSIYSLPPSNSAHQLKAQFAYNLSPTTRLNGNVQFGMMLQNAGFVSGSGNANVAAVAPPTSSLAGAIQTLHANTALTTVPFDKADLRIAYTIDDRRNQTPRNNYVKQYYQDAYSATGISVYNLPLSYQHQNIVVEGGYRITPQTKLSLGYNFDMTKRNYSATNQSNTNAVNAKLRTTLAEDVYATLALLHEDRQSGDYSRNAAWTALGAAENEFSGFVNYYEASRRREEVKGMIDFPVGPKVTATVIGKADYDRYPNSALGLRNNNNFSIGPDLTYQIASNLSAHGYYTYQMIFFNQASAVSNAACNGSGTTLVTGPAPCLNNGTWVGRNVDQTHTAGLTLDWAPMEALKLSADYTLSYGRNAYAIANGGIFSFVAAGTAGLQLAPIPDVTSLMNSVSLRAEYQILPNASLWLAYNFERFDSKDYATQVSAAQYSNALFSGASGPSYNVHQVLAAVRVRW